jgi:cell division transport system permease protein
VLSSVKAYLTCHRQALQSSLRILAKRPLSALMTTLAMFSALSLPVLFWVLIDMAQQWSVNMHQDGHLTLYLQLPRDAAAEASLLARVKATPGVANAVLESADVALAQLLEEDGMQDMMHYLPDNPLPSMIDVTLGAESTAVDQLSQLQQQLQSYPHVAHVQVDTQWLQRIHLLFEVAANAANVLMIIFAIVVMIIVGNTLRLVIYQQQDEIEILTLIGAKHAYIIRPFLYLGVGYGMMSALLSLLFVALVMSRFAACIVPIAAVYQMQELRFALSGLTVMRVLTGAMCLGWIGARLSVHAVLNMKPHA